MPQAASDNGTEHADIIPEGFTHPVGVLKHFCNLAGLGCLGEANHVVSADDLHEGEITAQADGGCQGRLASTRRTFQEGSQQCGLGAVLHLQTLTHASE